VNEEKATRYHRLKRRASVASLAWSVALLAGLLGTTLSVGLRTASQSVVGATGSAEHASALVVAVYVVFLVLLHEVGGLPLAFYSGFLLERRYGLSNERLAGWVKDQLKSLAVGLLLAVGAASVVYAFIRQMPSNWWLPTGAVFAVLIVGLTNLAPVLLLPLFYRVKPLDRESLRQRLLGLADRAGARVLGAYELGLGEKTKKANAALAGLGSTRRILVSDTMLAEYTDEEIEVVLAHELAHHVHGDIWKGILFEAALIFAGFYVSARVLGRLVGPLGLSSPADPAGLPVLLLAAGAVSLLMLPVAHAMSRAYERSADRFALELTRNPSAFVSAMRRLGAQNLAEDNPSRLIQWLFHSHPPIRERISDAQAFKV
jgi:STE24 endopeptidase